MCLLVKTSRQTKNEHKVYDLGLVGLGLGLVGLDSGLHSHEQSKTMTWSTSADLPYVWCLPEGQRFF